MDDQSSLIEVIKLMGYDSISFKSNGYYVQHLRWPLSSSDDRPHGIDYSKLINSYCDLKQIRENILNKNIYKVVQAIKSLYHNFSNLDIPFENFLKFKREFIDNLWFWTSKTKLMEFVDKHKGKITVWDGQFGHITSDLKYKPYVGKEIVNISSCLWYEAINESLKRGITDVVCYKPWGPSDVWNVFIPSDKNPKDKFVEAFGNLAHNDTKRIGRFRINNPLRQIILGKIEIDTFDNAIEYLEYIKKHPSMGNDAQNVVEKGQSYVRGGRKQCG